MARTALKRKNFMVEPGKVRTLRRQLRARSDSEAVRMAIDSELAAMMGLNALQKLQKLGAIEDVFNRAPRKRK